MIGAIAGDMAGSIYEFHNIKTKDFELLGEHTHFTDDTVHTVALMDAIMQNGDYGVFLKSYSLRYPHVGYGGMFKRWMYSDSTVPYNSYGNGAAMRVSPVGFFYNDLLTALTMAEWSANVTHNHPEGIKGAQATAATILMARQGCSKQEIAHYISGTFRYNLNQTPDEIRPTYRFNETCQGTVPQAICAFLAADSFEDTLRTAISLGGDSDTLACIAGGIAEAYYGVPEWIQVRVKSKLDNALLDVVERFYARHVC